MKTKLLSQIDFNAIEPMNDKQMVELNGGGLAEALQELVDALIDWLLGDYKNVACPTNKKCE